MKLHRALPAILLLAVMAGASPLRAQSDPVGEPCEAAKGTIAWGKHLKIPVETRLLASAYRKAWAEACARKKGVDLGALLTQADALSDALSALLRKVRVSGKAADALHEELYEVYPTFLPAIQGSVIEFEYVEAMLDTFRDLAEWGNAADKAFFARYELLFGDDFKAPVWIMRTWDYGGCARLASYDFIAGLAAVDALRKLVTARAYVVRLNAYESRLKAMLERLDAEPTTKKGALLSCTRPDLVPGKLEKLVTAIAGRSGYEAAAVGLARTLGKIRGGTLSVKLDPTAPKN